MDNSSAVDNPAMSVHISAPLRLQHCRTDTLLPCPAAAAQLAFFVVSGASCVIALAAAAFYAKKVLNRRLKQIREQDGAQDIECASTNKSEQQPLLSDRLSMRQ